MPDTNNVPFNNLITVTVVRDPQDPRKDTLVIDPPTVQMPDYGYAALIFQIKQDYPPEQGWRFPLNGKPDMRSGFPTGLQGHSQDYWNGIKVPADTFGWEFRWIVPLGEDQQFLCVVDANDNRIAYDYHIELEFTRNTDWKIYSDPTIKNRSDGARRVPELEQTAA